MYTADVGGSGSESPKRCPGNTVQELIALLNAHYSDLEGYCDCGEPVTGYMDDTTSWHRHVAEAIVAAIPDLSDVSPAAHPSS